MTGRRIAASSRWVPSMFHRRLLLLSAVSVMLVLVLVTQLTRLTVVQAGVWQTKAESVLVRRRLIPTARGRILDRRMRVLAVEQPSYNVCVRYPVLTDDWAYSRGRRDAYLAHRTQWDELDDDLRGELITDFQQPYDEQVRELWESLARVGQISPKRIQELRRRIVRKVELMASDVWLARLERKRHESDEPVELVDVAGPIGEQQAPHAILVDADRSAMIKVQQRLAAVQSDEDSAWKQVSIEPDKRREYPLESMTLVIDRSTFPGSLRDEIPVEVTVDGVGLHILGTLREVWKEDVDRRPFRRESNRETQIDLGGYLPSDRVGRWGIEWSQEDALRGLRGEVVGRLDSQAVERVEPQAGQDVVLTVDIQLQARVQALMDPRLGLLRVQPWHASKPPSDPLHPQLGEPLNGAAVVLDVAQGQVLAAVSTPTFSLEQLQDDPQAVWGDKINRPFLNRAIAAPYQPGSTVKPLVLAMAMTHGNLANNESIVCSGHLDPHSPNRYRCWIYKMFNSKHGPLDGAEAIARSCNIFFYTLGRRLGAEGIARGYRDLGLGRSTGCGLVEEVGGDLPNLLLVDEPNAPGFSSADGIFMAIGQGPVRWTPLQAAGTYATLARGGYVVAPTFLMFGGDASDHSAAGVDLNWNPAGVELAMRGMSDVVNQPHGTGHHIVTLDGELIFNIEGVKLSGKSGTAQAVSLWSDEDDDGRYTPGVDPLVRRGDHAWTICLAKRPGSTRADYVVAVVVEYGGSGGTVAGPVVNQILHAMRAEGYL